MSVITTYVLTIKKGDINKDIKKVLVDKGYVHSDSLYSPKRKKAICFDYVLDPEIFAPLTTKKEKERISKLNPNLTLSELEETVKWPLSFKEEELSWQVNYGYNDFPGIVISKAFPEVVFHLICYTEGHLNFDVDIKDGKEYKEGEKIMKMNEYERLLVAQKALCDFCEIERTDRDVCSKCTVTYLINDAKIEALESGIICDY